MQKQDHKGRSQEAGLRRSRVPAFAFLGGIFIAAVLACSSAALADPVESALELRLAIEQAIEATQQTGDREVAEVMRELMPEAVEQFRTEETRVLDRVEPIHEVEISEPRRESLPGEVEAAELPAMLMFEHTFAQAEAVPEIALAERIGGLSDFDRRFEEQAREVKEGLDRVEHERLHEPFEQARESLERRDVDREARDVARLEDKLERLATRVIEKAEKLEEKAEAKAEKLEEKAERLEEKVEAKADKADVDSDKPKGKSK